MARTPVYGIVGRGRLATHLARYFELESLPYRTWHRGLPVAPSAALGDARLILLAINDDALEPFLADHPDLARRTVVHFSGSRAIPGVVGLHPLMTFGPTLYDRATYRAIPFVGERGAAGFRDIFPALPNPSFAIDPAAKELYHALCVMAGNFPIMLWSKTGSDFERRLGLPRDVLRPYLERCLANALDDGEAALTGPLARGDRDTVARNIAALDDEAWRGVYRAFAATRGIREATP